MEMRAILLVCEPILLVSLLIMGSAWAREVYDFEKARRASAIRNKMYRVGHTIHRSLDAAAFARTVRRRVVELALLLIAVLVVAALALVPVIVGFI